MICLLENFISKNLNPTDMKNNANLFSAIIFVCLSLLLSCSKSDPAPAPSLVGKWMLSTAARAGCIHPSDNQATTGCGTSCVNFTFTATTLTYAPPSGAAVVYTYTSKGTTLTISNVTASGSVTVDFTFTVTSTALTLVTLQTGSERNNEKDANEPIKRQAGGLHDAKRFERHRSSKQGD